MSAFVCSDNHISAIVNFMKDHRLIENLSSYYNEYKYLKCEEIAQKLLDENYKSVNYRYKDNTSSHKIRFNKTIKISAIQFLKAVQCLDYQCCEPENYEVTQTAKILKWLKSEAISLLDGYEEAKWGIE